MDTHFDHEDRSLTVSLTQADMEAILNGETISESTPMLIGRRALVNVHTSGTGLKRFKEGLPIGHPEHKKSLGWASSEVVVTESVIDINIPGTLIASNTYAAEEVSYSNISQTGYASDHISRVRVEFEDVPDPVTGVLEKDA